ncbi:unnamed protein product [Mytilus coruscus]|uniref:Uncharacterized protein n=1 Tax=Mytilus coruscus TaxID=42192 RepID=A0A6J8B0Z7_MYTCO|nr:unnamed protein product [Mytilus coruscus]
MILKFLKFETKTGYQQREPRKLFVTHLELKEKPQRTNSVFIHIGDNYMASERKPEKLARDIASFSDYMITVYGLAVTAEVFRRGRKWVRNNGPSTSTAPVRTIESTSTTQPTVDKIAAAMIAQLRGAGLHLTDSSGVKIADDRLCMWYKL